MNTQPWSSVCSARDFPVSARFRWSFFFHSGLRLREVVIQLNDVDREVLVVGARNPIRVRVDVERPVAQRREVRVVEPDELPALDDRLDARVLRGLPVQVIRDDAALGPRLVMPVAEHHPVDADPVAIVVIGDELPERGVLVRQHEFVDVEHGDPSRLVLEVLAEMLVGAGLDGIARRSHDGALVAVFANDVDDGNLAVVVVEVEVIDAVEQVVIDELDQIGLFVPHRGQHGQEMPLLGAAGGRAHCGSASLALQSRSSRPVSLMNRSSRFAGRCR